MTRLDILEKALEDHAMNSATDSDYNVPNSYSGGMTFK